MIRGKRWGSRKPRVALAGALAAFVAMVFGAGAAQATTVPDVMTFDHGQVKLGGSATPIDIVEDGGPFPTFTSSYCTDTAGGCAAVGDFTITPGANFVFPPATSDVAGVMGETATFNLTPLANVTGHYNNITGVMTTNASNYQSDVTLAGPINAGCRVTPISLAFSTAKQSPFFGVAFNAQGSATAPTPPIHGVIDADWATLPTPGDAPGGSDDTATCASVLKVFTDGPGGIALGNGIEPVLNAPPSGGGGGSVTPPAATPKKKCKKAKKHSASSSKKSKCKKKKKK
jgi:hypothetical protein